MTTIRERGVMTLAIAGVAALVVSGCQAAPDQREAASNNVSQNNNVSEKEQKMVKVGLFVRLKAKPGKEGDLESFVRSGLPMVQKEPATIAWFGVRLDPSTFGIFDAFPDDAGRQAHLTGELAKALGAKAGDMLAQPPSIENLDVLVAKLP